MRQNTQDQRIAWGIFKIMWYYSGNSCWTINVREKGKGEA